MKHIEFADTAPKILAIGVSSISERLQKCLPESKFHLAYAQDMESGLQIMRHGALRSESPSMVITLDSPSEEHLQFIQLLRGTSLFPELSIIVVSESEGVDLIREYSTGADYVLPNNFTHAQMEFALKVLCDEDANSCSNESVCEMAS